MAHINADQHGQRRELLRELQGEEITTKLGVDLPEYVRGHRKVKPLAEVLVLDALGDDVVAVAHVLEALVEALVAQHHHRDRRLHLPLDQLLELLLAAIGVVTAVELDPVRLLNDEAKLLRSLLKGLEELVCLVVVPLLVDDGPSLVGECLAWLLDGEILQTVRIDVGRSAVCELHDWHGENLRGDLDRLGLNDDSPVLESLLLEEVLREVLDSLELLSGILAARGKYIAHAMGILSDGLRDSIDSAELGRNVALFTIDLDYEQGLLHISDFE